VNWEKRLSANTNASIDTLFDTFYSTVDNIIDRHAPLVQLSHREQRQKDKPWITTAITVSIKIKNNYFKNYLKKLS
jgi:hypothetical protein